ncbi:MAG: phosphodiester glycosidase family protein, partial [Acidimicrobiales bacterium]
MLIAVLCLSSGLAQAASAESAGASTAPATPYSWLAVLSETSTTPVTVTSGISYNQIYYDMADGDAHAFVLKANLQNPNVTLVPQLTTGALASGGATLSSTMARTGAVAGVNGDYFDRVGYIAEPAGDGQPTHMLIQHGQVIASGIPDGCGVVGYTQQDTLVIGREAFSGTVTDGSASEKLSAVNEVVWPDSTSQCSEKVGSPGLVLETPEWGARSELDEAAPIALLEDLGGATYRVLSIAAGATESPALTTGESALIGYGTSSSFVDGVLHVGQVISVADSVTPYTGDLQDAFGGGYLAVITGKVNPQIAGDNSDIEAATVIGVTESGNEAIVGVFDGGEPGEEGIGYSEMAGWLLQQGAYEGIVMDNGGSSEMDARLPGDTESSVLNSPSDGHERLLAECVCFYSTETAPGPAATVTLNGGNALDALSGATVDVPEVALDSEGNPASGSPAVTVSPASAAAVVGTTTTAKGEKEAV